MITNTLQSPSLFLRPNWFNGIEAERLFIFYEARRKPLFCWINNTAHKKNGLSLDISNQKDHNLQQPRVLHDYGYKKTAIAVGHLPCYEKVRRRKFSTYSEANSHLFTGLSLKA